MDSLDQRHDGNLQTLEAKQNMEKERIRKLKPKLLKKAKALRNI